VQVTDVQIGNLRHGIPHVLPDELFTTLASGSGMRVERIVSRGHESPPDFWYDQDEDELVVVLSGRARLALLEQGELDLRPLDFVVIPAHVKHRVSWTDPAVDTIWLAVFYAAE
jgi:cupin 2 domain-containing protein